MNRLLTLFLLLAIIPAASGETLSDQLKACSEIERNQPRLACFDRLVSSLVEERELTDEVGVRKKQKDEELAESYEVTITSCKKVYNRVSFTLENGQIWRQKNEKWLSTRKCEGVGTLSKDFFGYKLYIKALDKTVRVARQV